MRILNLTSIKKMDQEPSGPYLLLDSGFKLTPDDIDTGLIGNLILVCGDPHIADLDLAVDVTLLWAKKLAKQLKLPLYVELSGKVLVGG